MDMSINNVVLLGLILRWGYLIETKQNGFAGQFKISCVFFFNFIDPMNASLTIHFSIISLKETLERERTQDFQV